jgi:putative endopeptidase
MAPAECSRTNRRRWDRPEGDGHHRSEDVRSAVVWPRQDLIAKAPGIEWPALLDAAGLNDAAEFIIWHPKAIPGLASLVAKEPLEAWKDWLVFHSLEKAASFLPDAFVQESFAFHAKVLSGTPELQPRWQLCHCRTR